MYRFLFLRKNVLFIKIFTTINDVGGCSDSLPAKVRLPYCGIAYAICSANKS